VIIEQSTLAFAPKARVLSCPNYPKCEATPIFHPIRTPHESGAVFAAHGEGQIPAVPRLGTPLRSTRFLVMLRFFVVLMTGLALIAPSAHLYEVGSKMALSKADYFVAQKLYIGWWVVGLLLPLALIANLGLAFSEKNILAVGAAVLIAANLAIFYFFTYPVNIATQNWTLMPDNWQALRRQWEYSHVTNAGVTFIAFCLSILAALK
jgi:hypothetical protein